MSVGGLLGEDPLGAGEGTEPGETRDAVGVTADVELLTCWGRLPAGDRKKIVGERELPCSLVFHACDPELPIAAPIWTLP